MFKKPIMLKPDNAEMKRKLYIEKTDWVHSNSQQANVNYGFMIAVLSLLDTFPVIS
jgi:hypothetical protein